jgi:phosphoribosylformylglycinamidine synthase
MSRHAAPPSVTRDVARQHGMTEPEIDQMLAILGRDPSWTELGIFSVMWSEHCSYKSSRKHLRRLPTTGPCVVQGPGENAGVVDIGDGWVAVFKMESHNHPSYVEPHQGAATGVGGIMRDVFTMGARPIANMDVLRFGSLEHPKTRYLVHGVVAGIGGYGNCVGVATVGGELTFNRSYDGNCLVNAFTLGIARHEGIFLGKAEGVGNPVFYAGSRTGRDGIHGASLLASAEFDDETESKRPTVQVGDPFAEKLLIEACLEVMATGAVSGIQDMGAAGLTCSSCEMAGRAGMGLDLDLDRVPLREEGMSPYEIMLSESQERMLLVAHAGREADIVRVFTKWGLEIARVGVVTDTGRLVVRHHGEVVADVPARSLSENAPIYDRPSERPAYLDDVARFDPAALEAPADLSGTLKTLLLSPNLCSREWVFSQYDWSVRTNTVVGPGSDAAVVRVKENGKAIALTADCNPRYCYLDPRSGGMQAVVEAARNLACTGAQPLALTDCLNFGNPEKPEITWQFKEAIEGISQACEAFAVPVVSGNVSFYNETGGHAIHPTPSIAMIGLLDRPEMAVPSFFQGEGDAIVLFGRDAGEIGGSEYLAVVHGKETGSPPIVDLDHERRLVAFLVALAREGRLRSAHDVSDGGLATALAECCFGRRRDESRGCRVEIPEGSPGRDDIALFSESQGRVIATTRRDAADDLLLAARAASIPAVRIGVVTGSRLVIERDARELVGLDVGMLRDAWSSALPRLLGQEMSAAGEAAR